MLSRTSGSRAFSTALFLDFLLPGARASSSNAAPTWYQEILTDKRPKKPKRARVLKPSVDKPLHSLRTPGDPTEISLSPSELWKTWSLDVREKAVKKGDNVADEPHDIASLEPALDLPRQFLRALRSKRLPEVLSAWDAMSKEGTIPAIATAGLAQASRALDVLIASTSSDTFRPDIVRLRDPCIHLALRNEGHALRALLVYLVRCREVRTATDIFADFLDAWSRHLENDTVPQHVESEPDPDDDIISLATMAGEREVAPPLYSDMMTAVVVAFSLSQDFAGAIRLALRCGRRPQRQSAVDILPLLRLTDPQAKLAQTYLAHATTAVVAQNVASLRAHIQNLSGSGNVPRLNALYARILQGLGNEYSWATFEPGHISANRPVLLDESIFVHFIRAFCHIRRLDLVEKLWDDVGRLGHAPSVVLWTGLIQHTSAIKGVDYGNRLWNAMLAAKIEPDTLAYQALITAYLHERRMAEAIEKLAELEAKLKRTPASPDTPSLEPLFNIILRGYLNSKQHAEALALVERMNRDGPAPTIATYNTLMAHYTEVRDFKSVSWVLRKMAAEGLRGDGFTYSTLMRALLAVVPREEAVQRTLAMMDRQGVEPNVVTYSSIITHILGEHTEGAFLAAMDMLKWMEASNRELAPTVITYTSILKSIHERPSLPTAVAKECREYILQQMRKRQVEFTTVTYGILVKACLANGTADGLRDGLRYFREMRARNLPVFASTWYLVLDGLTRRQEWGLANALADELSTLGLLSEKSWLNRLVQNIRKRTAIDNTSADDVEGHGY
ncbi:hypothetical protein PENSPDRAFT_599725 [Peniophora sp. CONT]|nr:hypothetical protein PENSPDRAFT_599725 [Peniophora sp. CONT]